MSAADQDQRRLTGDMCGGDQLFLPGDLVWGKLIDQQWWPGQVQDVSSNSESKSVSTQEKNEENRECSLTVVFFDELQTSIMCNPSELRLFVSDEFKALASDQRLRESGAAFSVAVMVALNELSCRVEVEMTCKCVPDDATCHMDAPRVGRSYGLPMVRGLGVKEFFQKFLDAACDASRVDLLDAAVVRSWITAFFRAAGRYAPLPEYHRFQGIEDVSEVKDNTKEKETAEMIFDTDPDVGVEEDVGNVKDLISRKSKNKREEEETKDVINVGDSGVGGGDEEGLGLGRRERKKSKYLSPPYTMISSSNSMPVSPKVSGSVKHEDDSTPDEVSRLKPMAKCSKKLFVFDKNNDVSTYELLSELRFLALDSRYLIDNRYNEIIIGFFDLFRNSMFVKVYCLEDYNREKNCLGRSDGREVNTSSERDISSLEGKPDGFQIVNDGGSNDSGMTGKKRKCPVHNADTNEETDIRILGIDVNIPPEAHENCSCPEANGLTETNGSLELKPKKGRKGKSTTDKPNGSTTVKRRGRPKKVVGTTTQPSKFGNSSTPMSAGQKDVLFPGIPSSDLQLYLGNPIPLPSLFLPLQKPPLCFVKKSLEMMITTLNNSASNGEDAKSSTQLKPEAREKLTGEMSDLLTKVNKMLTNATAATDTRSPGANVHSST